MELKLIILEEIFQMFFFRCNVEYLNSFFGNGNRYGGRKELSLDLVFKL